MQKNTKKGGAVYIENIGEAVKSVKGNKLRTALTVAIIAIGIMSLVGILTAIDTIQHQIVSGMSDLGADSFNVQSKRNKGRNRRRRDKNVKAISFRDTQNFKKKYAYYGITSVVSRVTGSAEVKYGAKKTNPNSTIIGSDENYLTANGIDLDQGRNFSPIEGQKGAFVALVGDEIIDKLFGEANPINEEISINGSKYIVIGTLKASSSMAGNDLGRNIVIPVINANILGNNTTLNYTTTVIVDDVSKLEEAMGEATGLMRVIRQDKLGEADSFEVTRNETAAESMADMMGNLTLAAFFIGGITLLGASIGLMNIMLVSVTERTREIGVRKSLGAAPKHIRQQFLVEAIVICQIGGIAGVVMGIILGNVVAMFLAGEGGFDFVIPWAWMIMGLVICTTVGVISGFYPAYKASKLDPIESLRYE
jgi:putative ABC transport system permease protein